MTTGTQTLYGQCEALFEDYPLAVEPICDDGTQSSMVLMQPNGTAPQFYTLHIVRDGDPYSFCILRPWRSAGGVEISADASAAAPALAAEVLACVIPLPRHGSLFGWMDDRRTVSALMPFHTDYESETPEPTWTIMPRADVAENQWPPFAGASLFGAWFWNYLRSGGITFLDALIAATPDAVFWTDTQVAIATPPGFVADCCVVACDIVSPDGFTFPRGCYAPRPVLRSGELPELETLLADPDRIDLAPRFAAERWGA